MSRLARLFLLFSLAAALAPPAAGAVTFTVNTTNDADDGVCDGTHCSLREAIDDANALGGLDGIAFNIIGAGPHTIAPTSALPTITGPTTIDGRTEPDYTAPTPVVELSGQNAGSANGLTVTGGGSTVAGLAVNRWTQAGILLANANGNTVFRNRIGTDPAGTTDLGNGNGVEILLSGGNQIGLNAAGEGNVISGNGRGVQISGNSATSNQVQNNLIGVDAPGTADLGNANEGVYVTNAPANEIGGTTAGERNVISGNDAYGIRIDGTQTGNVISGNWIGINAAGTAAVANGSHGVMLDNTTGQTIGGATAGERNVISGNSSNGVNVFQNGSNAIDGNYIGLNPAGTAAIANFFGITVSQSTSNTIGTAQRNVVSGNSSTGITFSGANANQVKGNYIGPAAAGAALGNGGAGVSLDTSDGNDIGGTTAAERNVISDNFVGVRIVFSADSNTVHGNFIGVAPDGASAMGNDSNGVELTAPATGNVIGGTGTGDGNRIAFNGATQPGRGIHLSAGTANAVEANAIFSNANLGIDLGSAGVDANDADDPDSGANDLQNFPVLTGATSSPAQGTRIRGTVDTAHANRAFRIEFFSNAACDGTHGEGGNYLGFGTVTTEAAGDGDFSVTVPTAFGNGDAITATATDTVLGQTSEFSACITGVQDGTAPDTTLTSGPSGPTTDSTPAFTFTSTEPGTFECRVDGGVYATCNSGDSTAALADGPHTFEVRAVDALGIRTARRRRAASASIRPGLKHPSARKPGRPSPRAATFVLGASEGGSTFECALDGGAFAACSSPHTVSGLTLGAHSLTARATDPLGNVDTTSASHAFTVATAPPPPPVPDIHKTVVVEETSGQVRVKVPGGKFVPLSEVREIPLGASLDTRKGSVRVYCRREPRRRRAIGGLQRRAVPDRPDERLEARHHHSAPRRELRGLRQPEGREAGRRQEADTTDLRERQGQLPHPGPLQRCDGAGYQVADPGPLSTARSPKVTLGRVSVRDFVKRKSVTVRRGQAYLARGPGRRRPHTRRQRRRGASYHVVHTASLPSLSLLAAARCTGSARWRTPFSARCVLTGASRRPRFCRGLSLHRERANFAVLPKGGVHACADEQVRGASSRADRSHLAAVRRRGPEGARAAAGLRGHHRPRGLPGRQGRGDQLLGVRDAYARQRAGLRPGRERRLSRLAARSATRWWTTTRSC